MGYYKKQAICLNGHQLTDRLEPGSDYKDNFCYKCGESIITKCQECSHEIEGDYYSPDVLFISTQLSPIPWYCPNCATPYPWTKSLINNAVELAKIDSLDVSDIETIKHELPNVIIESQQTPLAKAKIANIFNKMQSSTKSFMRDLLKDVMVEVTIKQIFGN